MTRWSLLTIAVAVVACEGERDRVAGDASAAAAQADSVMPADTGAMETNAPPAAETERARAADKAETRAPAGADATKGPPDAKVGAARGPSGAEAMGGVRPAGAGEATSGPPSATVRLDLSTDEVRRLQTALSKAGCNAGTADGVVGRQTRQAIACGLEKNGLGSDDLNGLYRALDLDFD